MNCYICGVKTKQRFINKNKHIYLCKDCFIQSNFKK